MHKNEIEPLPYTYKTTQNGKDLNVIPKTIKLLEKITGEKLHDIGFGNDFLVVTPKAQVTEEKISKLDYIKI